jgi:hypothetical protein
VTADPFFAHVRGRRRPKWRHGIRPAASKGHAVCECCREAPKRQAQRMARARLAEDTRREITEADDDRDAG